MGTQGIVIYYTLEVFLKNILLRNLLNSRKVVHEKKKKRRLFYSPTDTRSQGRIHTHTRTHTLNTLALCPFGSSVLVFPSSIKLRYFRLRCIQYSPSSLSQVTVSGGSNLIPAQNLWEPFFNRELSSLVSDAAHSFKLVFISLWHGIFFFFFGPSHPGFLFGFSRKYLI